MKNYLKKTSNTLWKALLVAALVFNSSCATEETENIEITDNETPDIYQGKSSISLLNPEFEISVGTTYYIRNKNSNKVLDVEDYGISTYNVHQWTCYGTTNQQWKLERFDRNLRLKSIAKNFYLRIDTLSDSDGVNVGIQILSPHNDQKFRLQRRVANSTQFYIVNVHSGKVLDVANYSKKNGGNVYQWSRMDSNNSNQLWEFYKVSDY